MSQLIAQHVCAIPDFPIPGILFRDITPVLSNPAAFEECIHLLAQRLTGLPGGMPDAVVGIESRGFIFGAPLALRLGIPFLPVRKPGKLPRKTLRVEYLKEYGTDVLELHADAVTRGDRIAIVDDLLATGGTASAAGRMVREAGGTLAAYAFVIELEGLRGRAHLEQGVPVEALLQY